MVVNTLLSSQLSIFSFTKPFCTIMYRRFPQYGVKSSMLSFSDQGDLDPSQPSKSLPSFPPQSVRLDSSPDPSGVFSQLDFQSSLPLWFCSTLLGLAQPTAASDRNFHMSASHSEQGTQTDHQLLYPAAHVDTNSAKTQICFQQELTQRSVHVTEVVVGKYHLCLLAAGLDQFYKQKAFKGERKSACTL